MPTPPQFEGLDVEIETDGTVDSRDELRDETAVVVTGRSVRVRAPAGVRRFYRHGWQSWSQTRWLDVDEPVHPVTVDDLRRIGDDPAHADASRQGGAGVGALALDDGRVLLVGDLAGRGRVELTDDGLEAASPAETAEPTTWLVAAGAEADVFAVYARMLGDRLGRRPLTDLRVWCSWYSFYTAITEAELGRVIDELEGLEFDVVQVDDGWQRAIGDWSVNDDFPAGMPALAERIVAGGFRPGLWMAPFLVHERSATFADHPEWLLTEDGEPVSAGWNWGGRIHALDVTRADVLDHLAATLLEAVGWGFTYLKLDFLYAGALPGDRHGDVERQEGYRRAVQHLRDAVGEDVLLLACGAPVLPSIGVFDAIRVGPDVAEWWELEHVTGYLHNITGPQARYAVATSVHRLWLQHVIGTDPDVAYFRTRYCLLNDEQKALIADLTRVCRFRATSDDPATLDPDERRALADYLVERLAPEALGGYRYRLDGRVVDFGPLASQAPTFLPVEG